MKKSEVLDLLERVLERQRKDLNNGSDYQDAREVLDILETEIGMLPPFCSYKDWDGIVKETGNKWEPEDL